MLDARAPTGRDGDTVVDVRLQEVVHQDVSFSAEYSEGEVIPLVQHRGHHGCRGAAGVFEFDVEPRIDPRSVFLVAGLGHHWRTTTDVTQRPGSM